MARRALECSRLTGVSAAAFPLANDIIALSDQSAVPQKLRSGNAARKSLINALTSAWPRRGACNEYLNGMSGRRSRR
jgi:hypothetical protein